MKQNIEDFQNWNSLLNKELNQKEILASEVLKRDGRKEEFSSEKIYNALHSAFSSLVNQEEMIAEKTEEITNEVIKTLKELKKELYSVEEIQDIVEETLMKSGNLDVARTYIRYRYKRGVIREKDSNLMREIAEAIMAKNVQNSNANLDEYSAGGRMGEVSSLILKDYALNQCMSEMSRNNHLNNEIYIHDLNSYSLGIHNCLSIPFDDLLAKGFTTRQVDIRPANSISTAINMVSVIFQINILQQFGK